MVPDVQIAILQTKTSWMTNMTPSSTVDILYKPVQLLVKRDRMKHDPGATSLMRSQI